MGKPMPIARLIPEGGGEAISLVKPQMLLGRRTSCDIHLSATNISSHHCKFEYGDGQWLLHDLQSTNGTKVNGCRIRSKVIHSGDQVTIAKTRFVIEIESATK
jgi:pSer/pThr/pTyr-binding forkhead associated (FHA) protein